MAQARRADSWGRSMKRRIVLSATIGSLVGCVWIAYAVANTPDAEIQRSAVSRAVQVFAYVTCPIIAAATLLLGSTRECRKLCTSGPRLGTGPEKIAVTITEEVSEWRVARQR